MEPEKNMPPQENLGKYPEFPDKPSRPKATQEDFSPMCRTASITSFSSSSVSTEPKDQKCSSKEQPNIQTSQTSDISMDDSPRSSMNQALKSEKAFIEYVMSLPAASFPKDSPQLQTKTAVVPYIRPKPKLSFIATNTSNVTKVGLDHLDNLCKLMEQLSELRDTNTKLQKRVQYLEDLKTLHEMHKEIRREVQYGSESVLNQRRKMGLKKSLTGTDCIPALPRGSTDYAEGSPREGQESFKEQRTSKSTRSPSGRRSRGQSTSLYDGHRRERSKSVGHEEAFDSKSKRIFPKWSKVKEAFGWESERKNSEKSSKFYIGTTAAHPDVSDHFQKRIFSEQDSAALRIPLYCDYSEKEEMNFMDTYAGEAMVSVTDGSIPPFNSSAEDISSMFDNYRSSCYLKPKSLTIERDMDPEQAFAKFEKEESKKSHKSPWGRVKTIIERRRDSLKRRHLRRGPQASISQYRDPTALDDIDYDTQDICYDPLRKSSDDQFIPNSNLSKLDDPEKISKSRIVTKDADKERMRDSTSANQVERTDNSEGGTKSVQEREVMFRTPGSSPQFHRKSTWMKMKNVLRSKKEGDTTPILSSQSMPSSPNGVHDGTFDFEETEGLDDNQEEAEDFDAGHEITRVGSDSYVHTLSSLSNAAPVSDIMLKLQRNISDDFNRKMQQWERMRNSGMRNSGIRPTTTSPKWERKNSGSKSRKKSKAERLEKSPKPKVKDLSWLEKELQKIEKEKLRLSKEKEKYEERAERLERLRQTVLTARNSNKKEVLVRTSAGEFRFEGISDAFTKKLYEWETKRGLGPELSTIALLDSSLESGSKNCLSIHPIEKNGNLQRPLSRSESSLADIGQPSHTSSNSLPSLKPPDINDLEKVHQHSRANSEPDLSSFVGKGSNIDGQNSFVKIDDLTDDSSRDTLGAISRKSYAHPEVTRLIDSDVEEVLGVIESQRQEQRDENYYSLLEENVILLEQLKNKEEICRRLEKELVLLDEKVEEMSNHHHQEMERYREKLWEMHKPGSTPREVQGCLQVMVQLRSRIENLEKCTEKLKNEKESLEDSFRFHSAEQEHMTLDLLGKMRELHAAGDVKKKGQSKEYVQASFDIKIVERLQDLSSQLVKQTQELEQALAERTRQICQLRWELLHRDVSSMKLETELHSAQMQGSSMQSRACEDKRSKYAHFRSWSSEEASNRSRQLQECSPKSKKRLKAELPPTYYKLPKTDFQATELSNTVHKLNRELIRLSTAAESFLKPEGANHDLKSLDEKEAITWPESEDLQEFTSSSEPINNAALNLNPTSELRNAKISVRRNSAGSVSVASGMELGGSESSSINDDGHRYIPPSKLSPKLYGKPLHTSWTDSESSTEEEDFTKVVSFSARPEKLGSTILKTDYDVKHPHIRQKVFHGGGFDNMSEKPGHESKKKNDCTFTKKTLNWNSQVPSGVESKILNCSSAQSESNTLSITNSSENKKSAQNRITNNENALTLRNFSYSFPLPNCSDNTKGSVQFKSDSITQRNIQKKECGSHSYKSHSVRAAASDSKIPKCHKTNIKKSESCRESKKDGVLNSVSKANSYSLKKDSNRTKPGSFKRKNSNEIKDNLSTISIPSSTIHNTDCDKKMKSGCIFSKNPDCKNTEFQTDKTSSVNQQTPVMPQISVKRRQFSLQKQSHSMSEMKKSRKGFVDEIEDSSNEDDETSAKEITKPLLKTQNNDNRQATEISMPTIVLKLPKRKQKMASSAGPFNSEQNKSISIERDGENNSENNVTVTISKKKHLKTKTFDSMQKSSNPSISLGPNSLCLTQHDSPLAQNSSQKALSKNISYNTQKHEISTTQKYHNTNISQEQHANEMCTKKSLVFGPVENTSSIVQLNSRNMSNLNNDELQEKLSDGIMKKSSNLLNESCGEKQLEGKIPQSSAYYKSPSAPQLDWKKTCAKKVSREGAPNVKTLIEKYNQKVLEAQSPRSPCSSAYNSPATARKALPENITPQIKTIQFPDTSQRPKAITATLFYNPRTFKGNNFDLFPSPTTSPPTSPSSRARSEALLKAKEKFISSTNIFNITSDNLQEMHTIDKKIRDKRPNQESSNLTKRSATDTEMTRKQNILKKTGNEEQINRQSICSNKSCDSMSLVLCKTGETCQESRFSKRFEKQKNMESHSKAPESNFKPSKSLSNSSIFKSVTGYDLRLPSSFLRLRRSRKKKDMSTVSELCRQSLLLSGNESPFIPDEIIITKSARSCPSSPELKPKSSTKTSWFQRSLFRLK